MQDTVFLFRRTFTKFVLKHAKRGGVSFTKSITPLNDWRLFMEMETGSVIA